MSFPADTVLFPADAQVLLAELVADVLHDAFLPYAGTCSIESLMRDLAHAAQNY